VGDHRLYPAGGHAVAAHHGRNALVDGQREEAADLVGEHQRLAVLGEGDEAYGPHPAASVSGIWGRHLGPALQRTVIRALDTVRATSSQWEIGTPKTDDSPTVRAAYPRPNGPSVGWSRRWPPPRPAPRPR